MNNVQRKLSTRIFFSILWFVLIQIVLSVLIVFIYRLTVDGYPAGDFETEFKIGEKTGYDFGQKYGFYLVFFNTIFWVFLNLTGRLPGSRKFNIKNTISNR